MKRIETNNTSLTELKALALELRSKLSRFYFEIAEKKLKDTTLLKKTKKDLARVLTAIKNGTNS